MAFGAKSRRRASVRYASDGSPWTRLWSRPARIPVSSAVLILPPAVRARLPGSRESAIRRHINAADGRPQNAD